MPLLSWRRSLTPHLLRPPTESLLAAVIVALREEWSQQVSARSDSGAWTLVDTLSAQPVVSVERVAHATAMPQRTVLRAIDALVDAGVLHELSVARRHRMRQASDVLAAMDAFAERAGRRTLASSR